MTGFGTTPFGVGPFGVGGEAEAATFYLVAAVQLTLNMVAVDFSQHPKAQDSVTLNDALNPALWSLVAINPPDAVIRLPQLVQATANPFVVNVFFDGPLGPFARYRITVAGTLLNSAEDTAIDPFARWADFVTMGPAVTQTAAQAQTLTYDLASPQMPKYTTGTDQLLGTMQPTSDGSLELDSGLRYVAKRILRRLITEQGGFAHMPDYGLGKPVGSLMRTSDLRALQQDAQKQLLQEDGVVSASVGLRQDPAAPGVIYMSISVRTQDGRTVTDSFGVDLSEVTT